MTTKVPDVHMRVRPWDSRRAVALGPLPAPLPSLLSSRLPEIEVGMCGHG